jgi:hypothetical protein
MEKHLAVLGRSILTLLLNFFFDEHGGRQLCSAWAELYRNSCHGDIGTLSRLAFGGVGLIYSRAGGYRHGKFIVRPAHYVACMD